MRSNLWVGASPELSQTGPQVTEAHHVTKGDYMGVAGAFEASAAVTAVSRQ